MLIKWKILKMNTETFLLFPSVIFFTLMLRWEELGCHHNTDATLFFQQRVFNPLMHNVSKWSDTI